jgi:iron complex transport system ATP-binding protein
MMVEDAGKIAVRARDVAGGYDDRLVLENVSLDLKAGEMLAVVGPNGAGKSTLLKIVGGSLSPRAGTIELLERDIRSYDRRSLARVLAAVAQENSSAFQFSVMEIVLMGRAPHLPAFRLETTHDLEIAKKALKLFDLSELAGRPIYELSGGERKRAFLARALAQQPQILLLDEPTAFLDLRHVAGIFAVLRQLRAERRISVIVSLHDLNVAALYADHILMLKEGRPSGYGPPEEVFTEKRLKEVYGVDVRVGRNPATGSAVIYPAAPFNP